MQTQRKSLPLIGSRFRPRRKVQWAQQPVAQRSTLPPMTREEFHVFLEETHGDFSYRWNGVLSSVRQGVVMSPAQYWALLPASLLRYRPTVRRSLRRAA